MIAAATTSLPETPGGERNWDYRYSWVRDSTFMLWGLHSLGFEWEANDYFYFMQEVAQSDDLQVMYGIQGERELIEDTLDHLSRLRQRPPRADRQRRLQPAPARRVGHDAGLDLPARQVARPPARAPLAADRAARRGRDRELEASPTAASGRSAARTSTSSPRRSCAGSRATAARGWRALREAHEHAARWQAHADEIKADIIEHGCKDGVFTQHYETDALDASALLIPLVRFLPPDDERVRKTVLAIADNLTVDGLVLRYQVEETDDGLQGEEGTFTICSFWLVSALSEIGEHSLARDLCQKLLGYASPLHLYAEEIDPRSGRHLGNFPQAFTHLALINAVMHVIRADEKLAAGIQPLSAQDPTAETCRPDLERERRRRRTPA